MSGTFFRKLYQQLVLLLIVAIVLLAAYVSVGREFMPAVSRYTGFFENQIYQIAGVPVSIDSLTGSFAGFNPVLEINGLQLQVGEGDDPASSALVFDSARIVVDMRRSLWQRQWILEEFTVQRLGIDLVETDAGAWQVQGLSGTGRGGLDPEALFTALQRVSRLDLNSVAINLRNRFGEEFSFGNGQATIQNRNQEHFLHIDTRLQGDAQPLRLSFEVRGDTIDTLNGRLHARVPSADYSRVLRSLGLGDYALTAFTGGGELWLEFADGGFRSATTSLRVGDITLLLPDETPFVLHDLQGVARLSHTASGWQVDARELQLRHDEHQWQPTDLHVDYARDSALQLRIDNIDLSFLTPVLLASDLLGDAARQQLEGFLPTGNLRNLQATLPLASDGGVDLAVQANLDDVAAGSVRGSPAMSGIRGFIQVTQESGSPLLDGTVEVESRDFRINIPSLYNETWSYDFVNGRLRFQVDSSDGRKMTLSSGVMVAESPVVDGRVQFTSTVHDLADGRRDAELELLIGALRVDAARKAPYLPDAPGVQAGLRASMDFLERAIVAGDVRNSAVIFRGKTVPGMGPATRTFQSSFQVENGEIAFSPDWPSLKDLSAHVLTSDDNMDIEVAHGASLALQLQAASGRIRRNEDRENWLTITGAASGDTQEGLDYLQAAPLDDNLKDTFARWQTEGEFRADLEIRVPLNLPGREPDVRLQMALADNRLLIPEYDLELAELSGPVVFDTRTGLEQSQLSGVLFGNPLQLSLSSVSGTDDVLESIAVAAVGSTTPRTLSEWPRQNAFLRDLLEQMQGAISFSARLDIDQSGTAGFSNELTITSALEGLASTLPEPFAKPAAEQMPLALTIAYGPAGQRVSGEFGEQLQFDVGLGADGIESGVVYVGRQPNQAAQLAENRDGGLIILGEIERFELGQWTDFLDGMTVVDGGAAGFSEALDFIDVTTDEFSLYGQDLPGVSLRIEANAARQGWLVNVSGAAVQGQVLLPFANDNPLQLDMDYIRLPGAAGEEVETVAVDGQEQEQEQEQERVDALMDIDPRQLPLMEFATAEFMIGERDFGQWQFSLQPTREGARFSDLAVDFRGLRLGMEEAGPEAQSLAPQFIWSFDGRHHRSALTGVLTADNIGEVLLANGFAASLISDAARFVTALEWPGSPAFFSGDDLSGSLGLSVRNGRFLQESGGGGALKLVSIINLSAIMRRLRFSDDLLRRGLAFDEITGALLLDEGVVTIEDRLLISGPSSLYQITGRVDLEEETINGEMYVTLPVANNIPWLGLLTANLPLAVGAYLFDQIFGDQVDSLTSAVYTLEGPWEGLEPEFKQAFGSPAAAETVRAGAQQPPAR